MRVLLWVLLPHLVSCKTYGGYGGGGGGSFSDDGCRNGGAITKLDIWEDKYIDELQVTYKGGNCGGHGRQAIIKSGTQHTFTLSSDEKITKIIIGYGTYVDSLQFFTSKGRHSDKYGGGGGGLNTVDFGDEYLLFISGKAGKYLDNVSFITGGIKFIEYNIDVANPLSKTTQLETLQTLQHENKLDKDTSITLKISKQICHTNSYSQTSGFSSTQKATWEGGIPFIASEKLEVSITESFSWTSGNSKTDCQTKEESVTCPATPHSTILGILTASHVTAKLSFTGEIHFDDGSIGPISGTWTFDNYDGIDSHCEILAIDVAYIGCFRDDASRALGDQFRNVDPSNSVESCASFCSAYKYFGVQYGSQCFCGNSGYDTYGASNGCTYPCTGDSSETCGGDYANSVYGLPQTSAASVSMSSHGTAILFTIVAVLLIVSGLAFLAHRRYSKRKMEESLSTGLLLEAV